MQIISGKYARHKLIPPKGRDVTRPPLSRFRKAVFDTLLPFLPRGAYLDPFGGTGSFAIEALSRGASSATIIEMDRIALDTIRANLDHIGVEEPVDLRLGDALQVIPKLAQLGQSFAIIGLAPPYNKGLETSSLLLVDQFPQLLQEDGILFVQHPNKETLPPSLQHFSFWKSRRYGNTTFSYFTRNDPTE
ncbi:RsmD family RNA methyltransferase [Myxococcota bacterium]|nr:RsmD family RNA methyltransferase [Myxococcota bacterium]